MSQVVWSVSNVACFSHLVDLHGSFVGLRGEVGFLKVKCPTGTHNTKRMLTTVIMTNIETSPLRVGYYVWVIEAVHFMQSLKC